MTANNQQLAQTSLNLTIGIVEALLAFYGYIKIFDSAEILSLFIYSSTFLIANLKSVMIVSELTAKEQSSEWLTSFGAIIISFIDTMLIIFIGAKDLTPKTVELIMIIAKIIAISVPLKTIFMITICIRKIREVGQDDE